MITVDVNGKKRMSKEIREVRGNVRLYTSPRVGPPPAKGIIRAVTVISDDDYGQSGKIFQVEKYNKTFRFRKSLPAGRYYRSSFPKVSDQMTK